MSPWTLAAGIALLHFVLQAWPRLGNRYFGVDCWRHMLAADHIRRHRALPVTSMRNYLFEGPFDYPPFVAVLLALFPPPARLVLQAVLSPLTEVAHGLLVFALVRSWTGDPLAAAAAQVLFALVPITALENSQLSARTFGSLFLTLTLVGATLAVTTGRVTWLLVALGAGVLVHLTHKMASQTLVLFSVLSLPLVVWLRGAPLIGAASLLIALAVFPRLVGRILAGHLGVLLYHRRAFTTQARSRASVESPTFIGRLVALAKSSPLLTILGADPWLAPLLVLAVFLAGAGLPTLPVSRLLVFWLGAILVLILATAWIRPLRFLGDGPRYSFYLAFPIAMLGGPLLAAGLRAAPPLPILVVVGGSLVALAILAQIAWIQAKGVVPDKERSYRGDLAVIAERLRADPAARVAVFPLCTAEVLAFFADTRVLSTDSALAHAENDDFRSFNPCLQRPFAWFVDRYQVTHIVALNTAAAPGRLEIPAGFQVAYQGPDFTLWARLPAPAPRKG